MYLVILSLMLVFTLILLFVVTSAFLGFLITRVPFVRTRKGDIEFIVKELGITQSDVFYDLGSGDGKVCFLVNRLTGARCLGFELTWWTHLLAQGKRIVLSVQDKVSFKNKNFFKINWSEADFIYAYLYPSLMSRVEEKFLADCRPGAFAIIRDFPFPHLKPWNVYCMPKKHEIYVYTKK